MGKLPIPHGKRYGALLYDGRRLVECRTLELDERLADEQETLAKLRKDGVVLVADISGLPGVTVNSNKDSFELTDKFVGLMKDLSIAFVRYMDHKDDGAARPLWVRCDTCRKWRATSPAVAKEYGSKLFTCSRNDPAFIVNCAEPEKPKADAGAHRVSRELEASCVIPLLQPPLSRDDFELDWSAPPTEESQLFSVRKAAWKTCEGIAVGIKQVKADEAILRRIVEHDSATHSIVQHANICAVHGWWLAPDGLFLVTEWVEGTKLPESLHPRSGVCQLQEVDKLLILCDLARALVAMHDAGVSRRRLAAVVNG